METWTVSIMDVTIIATDLILFAFYYTKIQYVKLFTLEMNCCQVFKN